MQRARLRGCRREHGQVKPETAALAGRALHFDPASQQADQPLADRQTQSRALRSQAILPRLMKGKEDIAQVLLGDADAGVGHLKTNAPFLHGFDGQTHAAVMGKFDGIAQQIEQHLPQPARVGVDHGGQARSACFGERQPLFGEAWTERRAHFIQQLPQREFAVAQRQLARFDLGKIEHLVDQGKQVAAALADDAHLFPTARGQTRVFEQDLAVT